MIPDITTTIIDRLNAFLPDSQLQITRDNVLFALDSNVIYEGEARAIQQTDLMTIEQFEAQMDIAISNNPSWIHANLTPTYNDMYLISIVVGRPTSGGSTPAINISHELGRFVEIK